MADVMMMLGGYQFGLDSAAFQELNRNTEWRWPSQDVFESRPVLQFTGWGEDTITLPGVIFPEYWGGTRQLDELRDLGDSGEPQTLIDGRGSVLGQWVITGVHERQSVFAQGGVGRRQEFTVTLKRHQEDGDAIMPIAAASVSEISTVTEQTNSVLADAKAKASQLTSTLTTAAANVKALVGSVVTPVQGALNAIGQATSMARQVASVATEAKTAVKALGEIKNLSTAQAAMGGLMRAASNGAQVAANSSRVIDSTISAMQSAGDSLAAISTVKSAMIDVNRMANAASSIRTQAENIVRKFQ